MAAAPDGRTIRYYGTLGLVDRPAIEGRQAVYRRRHLLQLLAIKALQAAGLPLAEVQARLYGRSDTELEALWKSVSAARPALREVAPIVWREVTIEPGLKLFVDEKWAPPRDERGEKALEQRIRAVIAALAIAPAGRE